MSSLIREPARECGAGETITYTVSPLTLPTGRVVGDFSGFTFTIREDPLWPRTGADAAAAPKARPKNDGWAEAVTAAGTLVNSVPVFEFTTPTGAGERRYAYDVWGQLTAGGETQLVRARWLTLLARVE